MPHNDVNPNELVNYDFIIKKSATKPNMIVQLKNGKGEIINLSGATVRFRMVEVSSDTRTVDAQADIEDASNGEVVYDWSPGDTDTHGYYNAEFAVDYEGGTGSNFDPEEYFPSADYLTIFIQDTL